MAADPSGLNWIMGGAAAAVLVPALAIGLGMPFAIACAVSAVAGVGVAVMAVPRKRFAELDVSGAERGRIEFARELLTEAEPQMDRMAEAAAKIRSKPVADRVRHLVGIARGIFDAIEKDPSRIDRIRRFLTYYLPRAAEIAAAYGALERSMTPDSARLAATGALIDRLDGAFTSYAASLQEADLDKLDIELKLLKSALDEDIGPSRTAAAPSAKQGKV
jgi:5-bromo-4-chloroindolyl phosphate hydrolysis protein